MVFVKTDIVAKGISQDDIPENWVGRWANRSFRMRTMTVSESSPIISNGASQAIYPDLIPLFFVLNCSYKRHWFLNTFSLCFCKKKDSILS